MTLTRELRTSIAFILAIFLALTAFVWGNQRLVHADTSLADQILCWIDETDGVHPPVPYFNVGDCDGGPVVPPPPQCFDGIDNDNDGKTDWDVPGGNGDPGCSTPTDNDESDDPVIPAQCADGIDNDIDGLVDMQDPGCSGPDDDDESNGGGGGLAQCMDTIDNDNDGFIDYPADPGCTGTTDNDESNGNGGGGSGADLAVTKTVSDTSPTPSTTVTYTITVTSTGPASTTNVRITDTLPVGVSYISDDGSGAYATTTGVWTIGTMASGTTATLHITATVVAATGVEVINTASVTNSGATDPNSDNNTASVSFTSTEDGQGGGGSNDDDGDSSGGGSHHRRSSGGSSNNNNGEVLGAETECPMYLTGYIKQGANNDAGEVAKLQVFLNNFEGNALPITGTYGPATLAAVNAFQNKYAADILTPWGARGATGYVYYTTQKQINTIYCKFQKDFPLTAGQIEEIAYVRAIQPTIHAQGAAGTTAGAATVSEGKGGPAPVVGQVVLPQTTTDENARVVPQSAAAASASSTQGWFTKFVNWLFGR